MKLKCDFSQSEVGAVMEALAGAVHSPCGAELAGAVHSPCGAETYIAFRSLGC